MLNVNPGYLIMTLYIIICGNFMAPLLSCKLQNLLYNSMYLRHIIGCLTFIFFIGITNIKNKSFISVITLSISLYFVFIATTKLSISFWLVLFIIMSVLFLLETYKNTENPDKKIIDNIKYYEQILVIIGSIVLVIGFLSYLGEKKIEYKNNFNIITFLFGKNTCRNKSPSLTLLESFKGLVK
jgi:hypothetical protein